jgi:replicative DNA helicase
MQQPHSVESEQRLLGSLLRDGHARNLLGLTVADFYDLGHQHIWHAIQEVETVDLFTVSEWLARRGLLDRVGGDDYLMTLRGGGGPPFDAPIDAPAYATHIKHLAVRRRMLEAAQAGAQAALREDLSEAELLAEWERVYLKAASGITTARTAHISEVVDRVHQQIEHLHANPGVAVAMPTGFKDLDKMLAGGVRNSELIIVAARPSMGKSSFLASIILNNLKDPARSRRGAIFTLEMSNESLVVRLMSGETGIDSQRLRVGDLKDDEWGALLRMSGKLADAPLYLNDAPMTITEIAAEARRLKAVHGIEYLMIDFLGLVGAEGKSEYERVSKVALGAQALAKEVNIPIFLACQLSREVERRQNKRPTLADLRDSGHIEQAADIVLGLYRDEYYDPDTEFKNIAEILVLKQRNGPNGMAMLFFDRRLTAFRNLAKERIEL